MSMSHEECVYLAKDICEAVGLAKVAVAQLHEVVNIVEDVLSKHRGDYEFEVYSIFMYCAGVLSGIFLILLL